MKSKILGILITLLFVAGYATLNYPVLGTLYNQIREGKVIDSYDHAVHTMNKEKLQKYLEDNGFEVKGAEFTRIPNDEKDVTEEQRTTIDKMVERLEEDEDVQNVYTNMKPAQDEE